MKQLIINFLLLFVFLGAKSQDIQPLKSPDVTAFMNANYFPMNEYTGSANITIPIYTINLDGLEIPISLSYDTRGVKINTASSRVGLNWSLNTGGLISKQILGLPDLASTSKYNQEKQMRVYLEYGYLRGLFQTLHWDEYNVPIQNLDTEADLFYVAVPGLTTKFNHAGGGGKALELTKTGSIIYSPFQDEAGREQIENNIINFKITSPQGFVYDFKDREYDAIFSIPLKDGDMTNDLVNVQWYPYLTEEELKGYFESAPFYTSWKKYMKLDSYSAVHTSSITSPISKRSVKFYYADDFIVDSERRIVRQYKNGNRVSQTNIPHSYHKQKVIDKIVFPEGEVLFYYCNDLRQDIPSARRLKKIEVKNNNGNLIKGVVFEHDYFRGASNCNEPQCLRLKLQEINFFDQDGNVLPGYRFSYNTTTLPKRYSNNQDFTGYYNGNHNVPLTNYIPRIYYKAGQKKDSYLPFPLSGYSVLNGTATLVANETYAKAGILKKITYPTGGAMTLDYELNSFRFKNTQVKGGGLRIKSQTMFDSNGQKEQKINYTYEHATTTSGRIAGLPWYIVDRDYVTDEGKNVVVNQESLSMPTTNGSLVGYLSVKIEEEGNGFIYNEYSSASSHPNIYDENFTISQGIRCCAPKPEDIQKKINDGFYPLIYQDMDIKRGKLLNSFVYDDNHNLIKQTINQYNHNAYQEKSVSSIIGKADIRSRFDIGEGHPYTKFTSDLLSESYTLSSTKITEHLEGGNVTNMNSFIYDTERPLLKEKKTVINNVNTIKEKYIYPFDSDVDPSSPTGKLSEYNILTPIGIKHFENDELLTQEHTTYGDFGDGKLLPAHTSMSKGTGPLEVKKILHKYDKKGNLVEHSRPNGTPISALWGYNYERKIAEVLGVTYSEILTALNVENLDYLQSMSNSDLELELKKLRNQLPNAQIHTYLYQPLVGIEKATNEKEITTRYEYDGFNRLINVKDDYGNLISEQEYNYKRKLNISINNEPLQLNAVKGEEWEVPQNAARSIFIMSLTAAAKGGVGKYKYEWTGLDPNFASTKYITGSDINFITRTGCDIARVTLKVTDANGDFIEKIFDFNHTQALPCSGGGGDDFDIPSCFIAGTKIQMADKTTKNIEEVKIGDKVLTYNLKTKKQEIGEVENVVSPIHHKMVIFEFENGVKNTNTYDHPYYVKGKGWASYQPKLTKKNYDLDVQQIETGDTVLLYQSDNKTLKEIKLVDHKEIEKEITTYNLDKVSKNHNFFANGILVHNKSSFTQNTSKN
ncbi:hypothetical protein [Aquimarina sp. 2304DJ70-9]|uniref:hypothetical protein n=1 Tax=Aquimarina penaris TaxID=3231044 RepID=UPI0034628F7A